MTATPGWYAEHEGSTRHRWWDGTRWTEHVREAEPSAPWAPAVSVVNASPAPELGAPIWTIVFLPLITLPVFMAWDIKAYLISSMSGAVVVDVVYLAIQLLGWLLYGALIGCAVWDYRRLTRLGFVRPFHWAWAFLSIAVYVIGRSVVVRKQSGRGLAPIWVMIAVTVLQMVLITLKLIDATIAVIGTGLVL